jgi:hypothetical protein
VECAEGVEESFKIADMLREDVERYLENID